MRIMWITQECPYPMNTGGRVVMWRRIEYLSRNNEVYLYSVISNDKEKQYVDDIRRTCTAVNLYQRRSGMKSVLAALIHP